MSKIFRFAAVDFELASNSRASICQMGIALVKPDGFIVRSSMLIDPEEEFGSFQTDLHGIRKEDVMGAPLFPEALSHLSGILKDLPVMQHGPEDREFMKAACEKYGLDMPQLIWHDSHKIARHAWPGLKKYGLGPIAEELGISFLHHNAEEDAAAAAKIVLKAEEHVGFSFEHIVGHANMPKKKRRELMSGANPAP